MSMLTNAFASRSLNIAGADAVSESREMIKQFCLRALGVLSAAALLAVIIGLDTAFYVRTLAGCRAPLPPPPPIRIHRHRPTELTVFLDGRFQRVERIIPVKRVEPPLGLLAVTGKWPVA